MLMFEKRMKVKFLIYERKKDKGEGSRSKMILLGESPSFKQLSGFCYSLEFFW